MDLTEEEQLLAGGDLRVSNRSGKVTASDIKGNLHIDNEYGNITAERVDGQTRINSRSAEITLRNIGGPAHVSSPYSNVVLAEKSGGVNLADVNGSTRINGEYLEFEGSGIHGSVTVVPGPRRKVGMLATGEACSQFSHSEWNRYQSTHFTNSISR